CRVRTTRSPRRSPATGSGTATSSRRAATTGSRSAGRPAVRTGLPRRGFAIVVAATGWLYLIRPYTAFSGPTIFDALPLDELSRHSAVPLPVFVSVWASAAVLLALLARFT